MRIKRSVNALKKRRAILKQAKGYRGSKSKLYRIAREAVMKSGNYAYIGRRLKKRDFRRLWIARINAGCRLNDMSYSRFMNGLKKANISLNRKVLAELAISNPNEFASLVATAKQALA
ncbi:MAG: 50S ribosomal protein L20 [Firmicutes bacterium]|nr:50S ribosomal protein L20 [Bacillota bacterium]MDY3658620.1 50S ribosomal protein L20 [Eubacteriales bacterium]